MPHPPATIALFGTSADPPTHGHRALLEGLLALYPRVATWASDNPLKSHGAPLHARTALLEALVAAIGDPRLQVVPELSSPWTLETLARARQRWPEAEPVFVVGSDLLPQIPRWRAADTWLAGCRLAVAPRRGWPVAAEDLRELERRGARVELLPLEIPASASSSLRDRLTQGPKTQGPKAQGPKAPGPKAQEAEAQEAEAQEPSAGDLPPELWPVLLQHNLYGHTPP